MAQKVHPYSIISDFDVNLFDSGKHTKMFDKLGSHITEVNGESGVYFAVYAPAALQVQVIGALNYWNGYEHNLNTAITILPLEKRLTPTLGYMKTRQRQPA